jgi:translation elongation factor EF-1beta
MNVDDCGSGMEIKVDIVELNGKIDRITDSLDVVKTSIEDIATGINKLKTAVYSPDEGLYARLRELESWKEQTARVLWLITTSVVGLATATAWKVFL